MRLPLLAAASANAPPSKPATALADPWPAPTVIPRFAVPTDSADWESELAVVLGRACKNVRAL